MPALLAIAFSWAVFRTLPENYFMGDDFVHLFALVDKGYLDFATEPWGGHVLLASHTVLYGLYRLVGPSPPAYFSVVLLTHLANVLLLFHVVRGFTGSPKAACLTATLWGTSPVVEGALGWLSVYGQVLVATLLLAVLCDVARWPDDPSLSVRRTVGWCLAMLVASISFGVGVGLALAFPAVAMVVLPSATKPLRIRLTLAGLPLAVGVVYAAVHVYHAYHRGPYDLTLDPLDLLGDLRPMALFTLHLLCFAVYGLLCGWVAAWVTYPAVSAYVVAAGFGAALLAAAITGTIRERRGAATCALMALAAYATVAAGRAKFYGGVEGLAASVRLTRYHYVGTLPVAITLSLVVTAAARWLRWPRRVTTTLLVGWLVGASVAWARSDRRIDHHLAARLQTEAALGRIRQRVSAGPAGMPIYVENQPFVVGGGVMRSLPAPVFAGLASVFCIFFPENTVDGRRVYFVVRDEAAFQALMAMPTRRITTLVARPGSPGGGRT